FEVFLWPDERYPAYFEYEISPLNRELPILIPNFGGQFLGWRPWHYERNRLTRKATDTIGGPKQPQASIQGWRAEFFIPYALLRPLQNVPPKPGTTWRANVYRMDYDEGKRTQWEWAHVEKSFHEHERFGELLFADRCIDVSMAVDHGLMQDRQIGRRDVLLGLTAMAAAAG